MGSGRDLPITLDDQAGRFEEPGVADEEQPVKIEGQLDEVLVKPDKVVVQVEEKEEQANEVDDQVYKPRPRTLSQTCLDWLSSDFKPSACSSAQESKSGQPDEAARLVDLSETEDEPNEAEDSETELSIMTRSTCASHG